MILIRMSLEADVQLVTLIYEWLQDPAVAYPDGMLQCLKEIFDQGRQFVCYLFMLRLSSFYISGLGPIQKPLHWVCGVKDQTKQLLDLDRF